MIILVGQVLQKLHIIKSNNFIKFRAQDGAYKCQTTTGLENIPVIEKNWQETRSI